MEHPKISAVLITRHKEYPEIILDRLTATEDFFDEIIIIPECPSIYHRYLAAKYAKNDLLFVQDDDCMVNHHVLFRHYNGRITNAMPKAFIEKYAGSGITLVGWGCYFDKSMIQVFDRYIAQYGVDDHLFREADRIFTYLNQPHNTVLMPHEDLFQDETRMGMQPDHYTSMEAALQKVKALI